MLKHRSLPAAFGAGVAIGILGGLIGLGGAEFRLPLLLTVFRFQGLEAVILNKATSLVVVATALPFRTGSVPLADVAKQWPIIMNLLTGSLLGAWFGAAWATRLRSETLYRIIAGLLVIMAVVLLVAHDARAGQPMFGGLALILAGIGSGFAIGVVASLLGVAGGEFLIPTLILLFGLDVKLAGSVSLAVSLPTMLVGFLRYSRDRSFSVLATNSAFLLALAVGSATGTLVGAAMLGWVPNSVILPILAAILLVSAVKLWRHRH